MATDNWLSGTGLWSNGAEWSLGTAPAAGDTAVLTAGSINASTLTLTVGRWIQTGGTLSGTGTLTVTGSAQFSGSYDAQTGTGKTLLKGATQVDDSYLTLDGGRTLENAGTLTLQSGTVYLGYDPFATTLGGGRLVNDKGASFLIESDGTNVQVDFGTTGFTNAGLVEKEFSSGVSNIYAAFTNIGTVSVQSGTLSFDGGGSSNGGAFTVAAGATLAFGGGTFTLTGGTYSVVGQTLVSGGTLSLAGGTMTAGEFAQSYGTIAGASTLTVTGSALFSGSYDAETGTGKTLLKGLTHVDDSYLTLDGGRTLENAGTLTVQSGTIYLGYDPFATTLGGAMLVNDKGASFLIESDGTSVQVDLGSTGFTNAGLIEKELSSGTSNIYAALTNTGTVSVQSGTLSLDGGGTSNGGAFTVAAGALLGFGGGTFTVIGGTYTIAGETLVSGGTANFAGAAIGSFGNSLDVTGGTLALGADSAAVGVFSQSYGTVTGTGTLTVTGSAEFSGSYGAATGTGKTLLKGATQVDDSYLTLDGGRTLENAGTLTLQSGTVYLGYDPFATTLGGGRLVNDKGASFLIESDGTNVQVDFGTTGFTNAGLVEKEFSSGVSNIYAAFTNIGTVSVQSGTLSFDGGGTSNGGAFTVAAGAILGFGGGNFTLTGGTYSVAGQTLVSGGTLTLAGGSMTAGEFSQSYGTIAGTNSLTVTGSALFSGSYDAETGTGKTLLKGMTHVDNAYLTLDGGRTLENAGTLTLQSGTIYLGYDPFATTLGGATFVNDKGASFLIESDGTNVQVDLGKTGFTNAGLVEKEFSSGTSNIYAVFANTGTVSVQSGTISFDGGGTSNGGAFTVAAGALLGFGGGTFTVTGGTYTIAGETLVSGGTANFAGAAIGSFGNSLDVTGGTLALGADSATVGVFSQSYGMVAGTGTLTVTGSALFSGSYDAATGTGKTLLKGATQVDDSYLTLDGGRTLENAGTLSLQSGTIYLGYDPFAATLGGGTLVNDKGASFLIEGDGAGVQVDLGKTGFTNAGLVEKEFSSGVSNIYAAFANTGTVSVQSGILSFDDGGSSNGGAFTVAAGATLGFGGGTFTLTGGTYSVAGQTLVSGGTTNFAAAAVGSLGSSLDVTGGTLALGAQNASVGGFSQSYGTVSGTGTLTVTGPALFSGSYNAETGTGKTLLKGATQVDASYLTLDGGRTLENAGTLTVQSGTVYLGYDPFATTLGGGKLVNDAGASFLIESDGSSVLVDSGSTSFSNGGLVEKLAGTGTSSIYADFIDTNVVSVNPGGSSAGTVSVQSGTLSLDGGGSSNGGAFTVAADATLAFGGGTFTLTGGTYSVVGHTVVAGGYLDVDSAVASGKAISIDSGTLEFAVNSPTTVTFAGSSGKLILDHSQTFAGIISGMTASTPGDVVDLKDINFATATRSYSGSTTTGILTIKDGTHTAKLSLIGDFTTSSFILENDGTGHVQFYDPASTAPSTEAIASRSGPMTFLGEHAAQRLTLAGIGAADLSHSLSSSSGHEPFLAVPHFL